jgi:hypothetical protein
MSYTYIPPLIYTSGLTLHKDARADLDQLRKDVPGVHARLVALLAQIKADESLRATLLVHDHGQDKSAEFGIKKWHTAGENFWRMRCWELESYGWNYRLIYLYLPSQNRFAVMGVFRREDFDYDDPNNPCHRRVLDSAARTYGSDPT